MDSDLGADVAGASASGALAHQVARSTTSAYGFTGSTHLISFAAVFVILQVSLAYTKKVVPRG
jgi:hypothetical protein